MKPTSSILTRILAITIIASALFAGHAQAAGPALMENLDRGVIAVRATDNSAFISWRLLGTERSDLAFDIYRAVGSTTPVKLNSAPITGGTNYTDTTVDFSKPNTYTVRAVTPAEGKEMAPGRGWTLPANAPVRQYLSIPLAPPPDGTTPDGVSYTYVANDCSTGDLDGDGQYEIILKWDPTNSHDNAHSGYTGNAYLDAYKLDGTRLWRIDLGRNIRAGAHYTQFMVYDLDGDGKAEVACKTADGTVDGVGKIIGDAKADYRNERGFILDGSEFLTVFNGATGAAMATVDYVPTRGGNGSGWGDSNGNRVDRFLACVAYLDGQRPSLVMCRGYYTRAVLAAWDWRDGKLTQRWVFDSDDGTPGNAAYRGQGAHSINVGDLDGDGFDEILYGAAAIDHDGKGLYSTGLGHGDAQHMSVMDPAQPNSLKVWMVHESPKAYGDHAIEYRDARTGKILFSRNDENWKDVGRGCAADIDPRTPGYEMWASQGGLYNCNGTEISKTRPRQVNFLVWWDGDFLRELLDGNTIFKWNWQTETSDVLLKAPDCMSNNGTKSTPGLSADLFGDWREEVVWRSADNTELRIYTTTIPTEHRLFTLMHDRQYRESIAWQNTAYNQPPHPSFYLGEGMTPPAKPNIVTDLKYLNR